MAIIVTAIVGYAAGTVAAAEVFTAVAELGTAMSVVGVVTGNSTLTKVGAVMGVAGGVGSLASGAFTAAGSVAASDVAPTVASDVAPTVSNDILDTASAQGGTAYGTGAGVNGAAADTGALATSAQSGANSFDQLNPTTPDIGGAPNPNTIGMPNTPSIMPSDAVGAPSNGILGAQPTPPAGVVASVDPTVATGLPNAPGGASGTGSSFNDATGLATDANGNVTSIGSNVNQVNAATPGTSWYQPLLDFANQNKAVTTGAMQIAGGALSGLGSAYTANRNYELNQQALVLKQQQQANQSAQVQSAGIINSIGSK